MKYAWYYLSQLFQWLFVVYAVLLVPSVHVWSATLPGTMIAVGGLFFLGGLLTFFYVKSFKTQEESLKL